jgi:hypothetical protein
MPATGVARVRVGRGVTPNGYRGERSKARTLDRPGVARI